MKGTFPIEQFRQIETPFYYYDTALLRQTLKTIVEESGRYERFHVHYAIKANANPKILSIIGQAGLGADCVSGGEIKAAIAAGIPGKKVVFAGVGKSD
ncbi:MAG: diaminopimelate decarboxylase, partial [Prevotella sp.]|nr:diaminopimelate decarboxylase [Prevotella sp.]